MVDVPVGGQQDENGEQDDGHDGHPNEGQRQPGGQRAEEASPGSHHWLRVAGQAEPIPRRRERSPRSRGIGDRVRSSGAGSSRASRWSSRSLRTRNPGTRLISSSREYIRPGTRLKATRMPHSVGVRSTVSPRTLAAWRSSSRTSLAAQRSGVRRPRPRERPGGEWLGLATRPPGD